MLKEISHLCKFVTLISLVGKPTAGKGLKSQIMAAIGADFGIDRITTSDMIRLNIKERTALGKEYAKHQQKMHGRKLVPCDLILPGLADAIIRMHQLNKTTIIIDGSPRSEIQAKALLSCRVPFHLFEIDINDEEAMHRTKERARFEPRHDDSEILEGLKTYRDETMPAIRLAKKAGVHCRINGVQPIHSQIAQILRKAHFPSDQFKMMMRRLDNVNNPGRKLIDIAEGKREREIKTTSTVHRPSDWCGQHQSQTALA